MTRKKKFIIGCGVGLLIVIAAGIGAFLWFLYYGPNNGNVVKNYVA